MALTTFNDFSTTPASNIDVNGTSIQGTAPVSNFDNALRELMAILRRDLDNGMVYTAKSANYTAVANDNNAALRFTTAATLSLTAAATLAADWHITVIAEGVAVTIDPDGAETINGAATLTLQPGDSANIICSGTAFFAWISRPSWERIGGVKSLAGATSVQWTDLSPYSMLRFRVDGTPASSSGSAFLRVSQDNGATWNSGASDYTYGSLQSANTTTTSNAYAASSFFGLSASLDANISTFKGEITNFNAALASLFQCDSVYSNSSIYNRVFPSGYRSSTIAHNALQFSTTNGLAWASGTAILEGIRV